MNKYALLVGINNYKGVSDLRGCLEDVRNIQDILTGYFGFTSDRISVLTNEEATKENIISGLKDMVLNARKNDQLVFHFSGHGSQVRDLDNDELKDHLDELICPYDMNWDNGFITDDMLRTILDDLETGIELEIILDCCHSGTGTREIARDRLLKGNIQHTRLSRFLEPPEEVKGRLKEAGKFKFSTRAFRTDSDISLNHVLWTGCLDSQTSADASIDGIFHGAFSYYFCKHIKANDGLIARKELLAIIMASLKQNNFDQTPQLECTAERKVKNVFGRILT